MGVVRQNVSRREICRPTARGEHARPLRCYTEAVAMEMLFEVERLIRNKALMV